MSCIPFLLFMVCLMCPLVSGHIALQTNPGWSDFANAYLRNTTEYTAWVDAPNLGVKGTLFRNTMGLCTLDLETRRLPLEHWFDCLSTIVKLTIDEHGISIVSRHLESDVYKAVTQRGKYPVLASFQKVLPLEPDIVLETNDDLSVSIYRYGDGTLHPTNDAQSHRMALNNDLSLDESKSIKSWNGALTPSHPAMDGDMLWTVRSPHLGGGMMQKGLTAVIKKDTRTGKETVWARLPGIILVHEVMLTKNWFVVVTPSISPTLKGLLKSISDGVHMSDFMTLNEQQTVQVYLVNRHFKNIVRKIDLKEVWNYRHITRCWEEDERFGGFTLSNRVHCIFPDIGEDDDYNPFVLEKMGDWIGAEAQLRVYAFPVWKNQLAQQTNGHNVKGVFFPSVNPRWTSDPQTAWSLAIPASFHQSKKHYPWAHEILKTNVWTGKHQRQSYYDADGHLLYLVEPLPANCGEELEDDCKLVTIGTTACELGNGRGVGLTECEALRSYLLVVNGSTLEQIDQVQLPHVVAFSAHGLWEDDR